MAGVPKSKPSNITGTIHYDDEGYVIRWWSAMIPSNSYDQRRTCRLVRYPLSLNPIAFHVPTRPHGAAAVAASTHRGAGRDASRICAAPLRAHGASTQQPPRGSQHLAHAR